MPSNPLVHVATLALAPLLWLQGRQARARTPRLPDATGDAHGLCGRGAPECRLLVVGESPVAGVGHDTHDTALPRQLGHALAEHRGHAVRWEAHGLTGGRVADWIARVEREDWRGHADVAVIIFGVNDTTSLRSPARYAQDLVRLVTCLRTRVSSSLPLLLCGVPTLEAFPALPQPLRNVMGWRAACLDRAAAALVDTLPGVMHVPTRIRANGDFASDGYHPGPIGCRDWATALAPLLTSLLAGETRA